MFKTSSKTKSQCALLVAKGGVPLPPHCFTCILPLLGHGGWPSLWKRAKSQSVVLRHAHTRTSKQAFKVLNTFRDESSAFFLQSSLQFYIRCPETAELCLFQVPPLPPLFPNRMPGPPSASTLCASCAPFITALSCPWHPCLQDCF